MIGLRIRSPRRLLALFLAAASLIGAGCASPAEETVTLRFPPAGEDGAAYTVRVDDPSIVAWETGYDAASAQFVIALTGLAPGAATVSVFDTSADGESGSRVYTASVDGELRLSLSPVRAIAGFFLSRGGEILRDSYRIVLGEEGYRLSVSDGPERPVSAERVAALLDAMDAWGASSWDGFSETNEYVLDGESFRLEVTLTDGAAVRAGGDNAFPAGYPEAMDAIWEVLTAMQEEAEAMRVTITAGDHVLTATLYDNEAGRALWDMLPLTLPMRNLYGREMCYRFGPGGLPDGDAADTPYRVGDISYWPPAGSLVLLYGQNGEVFEQQPVGRTEDDVSFFEGMPDTDITFAKAGEGAMVLTIGGTAVPVTWEDNPSVEALKALLPLTIPMSMYGGFEQVGPIGQSIVREDAQTTTQAGDIVLYSGSQIVIFYGPNSWAYTRLGHVELSREEMAALLGNGDVTVTLTR